MDEAEDAKQVGILQADDSARHDSFLPLYSLRYMWSTGRVGRLILLLFLALVAYLLLKGSKAPSRHGKHKVASDRPAERMVECAHCGVHLPESESLSAGGKHFCSEEHRRLAG